MILSDYPSLSPIRLHVLDKMRFPNVGVAPELRQDKTRDDKTETPLAASPDRATSVTRTRKALEGNLSKSSLL